MQVKAMGLALNGRCIDPSNSQKLSNFDTITVYDTKLAGGSMEPLLDRQAQDEDKPFEPCINEDGAESPIDGANSSFRLSENEQINFGSSRLDQSHSKSDADD